MKITVELNPSELADYLPKLTERVAQLMAHRVCTAGEHNPFGGKVHGCCVVCNEPWPCPITAAGTYVD